MSDFWTKFADYQDLNEYQSCLTNNSVSVMNCQTMSGRCVRRFDPEKDLDMCYHFLREEDNTNKYVSSWIALPKALLIIFRLCKLTTYSLVARLVTGSKHFCSVNIPYLSGSTLSESVDDAHSRISNENKDIDKISSAYH